MTITDNPRILYIEDDEAMGKLVQRRLSRKGLQVDVAPDGRKGLEQACERSYDVALVDYHLPALDGLEVLFALKERGVALPAIMVSGASAMDVVVEAMRLGAVDWVFKEADAGYIDLLVAAVDRALRTQRLEREKVNAEKALRESEALKSTILERAVEAIITVDEDGRVVEYNPAAQETFGYAQDEAIGRRVGDLIIPASLRPRHEQGFERFLETGEKRIIGKRLELTAMRKGGLEFPIELSITSVVIGERRYFTALIRDITKRRQIEDEARRARIELERRVEERTKGLRDEIEERKRVEEDLRKLTRAVEQSGSAVVITDLEGGIEFVNPKFSEMTGYPADEVLGSNPRIVKSGEMNEEVYGTLWRAITSGKEWRGELCNKRKDGSLYWVTAAISPVKGPGGSTTHYVAIEEDITDRKKAAEELLKAKEGAEIANRAKTEFLANMSHELRTPLNSIIGFAQIISNETFGPVKHDQYKDYANDISNSGMHLLELINDILDVSRIETDSFSLQEQDIDVVELMRTCARLIRERADAAGLKIEADIPTRFPKLHADERRVKQILLNMLANAVKFTEEGGRVGLNVKLTRDGGMEFEITDTGIGIAEEDIETVMSPFGQVDSSLARKYEGAGLGLPLSRKLVELHGGALELNSELGVGTRIAVRFPPDRTLS